MHSEGRGASQPRSEQLSEDNSLGEVTLWSIMFIRPMWESRSLAIFIIMFSVVREVSPFASTHSEPLRAAVLDSTHSMRQLEIQDEVQF